MTAGPPPHGGCKANSNGVFRKIDLVSDAVVTSEDRIVCAAGPMSWVDLLLRLIEMVEGHETARLCADYAVIDTAQRTQADFMPLGYVLTRDPLLLKADMLVRRADKAQMTVRRLADALGLSERTLNRRFIELTHEPPQAFIMRRRIEHARTSAGDNGAIDQDDCPLDRLRGRKQFSQGVSQTRHDVSASLSGAASDPSGIAAPERPQPKAISSRADFPSGNARGPAARNKAAGSDRSCGRSPDRG